MCGEMYHEGNLCAGVLLCVTIIQMLSNHDIVDDKVYIQLATDVIYSYTDDNMYMTAETFRLACITLLQ